jgi:hypothetical protein
VDLQAIKARIVAGALGLAADAACELDRRELLGEVERLRGDSIALSVAENALRTIVSLAPAIEDSASRRLDALLSAVAHAREALCVIGTSPASEAR